MTRNVRVSFMQVPLYLFNPSYITSSYAANDDRVQSAMLRIKSASATQWTTIRNLSAIETSLVCRGTCAARCTCTCCVVCVGTGHGDQVCAVKDC